MKRVFSIGTLSVFSTLLLLALHVQGQDAKEADGAKPTTATADKKPAAPKGRVPNQFGKLGLTDEQKQKIYDIQARHGADIDKLEKQLADAKAKEMQEIVATLTEPQKKTLVVLEDAAKAKAAETARLRKEA